MNVESRLPRGTRDLAERITQTYRAKPGYTDPDLRREATNTFTQRQKERPRSVVLFEALPEAAKYAARIDDSLSILETPSGGYCVTMGSGYASAIFAGCRMVAFEPTREDLEALTGGTDTIEEV